MKGLDTSVLVRLLTKDDPRQSRRAIETIEQAERAGDPLLIGNPVLMELNWVLRSAYRYTREEIIDAYESLGRVPVFKFEHPDMIGHLIALARSTSIEISDIIIGLSARFSGCDATLTFDKKAARLPYFSPVK